MDRIDTIKKLCDDYCHFIARPNGDIAINPGIHELELISNNIHFHDLTQNELLASIVGLSKTAMQQRQGIILSRDHKFLWAWCGALIVNSDVQSLADVGGPYSEHDTLYQLVVRGALANIYPLRKPEMEQTRKKVLNHFATYFIQDSNLAIAYLALPLLEGLLKRLANAYVEMDGVVKSSFTIKNPSGEVTNYGPLGQKGKSKCSSLRDLLYLYTNHIAEPDQVILLNEFYEQIKNFGNTATPIDLIGDWRNQSLHGTTHFPTIGIAILHLCFLISIGEIRGDFSKYRSNTLATAKFWNNDEGERPNWSFYPPY